MKKTPDEILQNLAHIANAEPHPSISIAASVLKTLQAKMQERGDREHKYFLLACGFLTITSACLLLFWWTMGDDTLLPFAQPFLMVLQ